MSSTEAKPIPVNANIDMPVEETYISRLLETLKKTFLIVAVFISTVYITDSFRSIELKMHHYALYAVIITFLISIIGVADRYVYSNVLIGIGLAYGLLVVDKQILVR
jgi:membrane-associated HD superfamily phosphohydrolase